MLSAEIRDGGEPPAPPAPRSARRASLTEDLIRLETVTLPDDRVADLFVIVQIRLFPAAHKDLLLLKAFPCGAGFVAPFTKMRTADTARNHSMYSPS